MLGFERNRDSRLGRTSRHRRTTQSAIAFLQGMGSVLDIFPVVSREMPKLDLYRKITVAHVSHLRRSKEVLFFERTKVRQLRNAK